MKFFMKNVLVFSSMSPLTEAVSALYGIIIDFISKTTPSSHLKKWLSLSRHVCREAARECRRKKKEYVKCLENRVAVLENQNQTLIKELNLLKDIYKHKAEWSEPFCGQTRVSLSRVWQQVLLFCSYQLSTRCLMKKQQNTALVWNV